MGFKVQFENGQTVEFDSKPSDADIDEAFQATSKNTQQGKLESQNNKVLDAVGGVAEGALGIGSSLVSGIPQGLRALGELAGGASLDEAQERAQSSGDFLTYQPRTKTGKRIVEGTMETLDETTQQYGRAFSKEQSQLAQKAMQEGRDPTPYLRGENTERMVGEMLMNVLPIGAAARAGRGRMTPLKEIAKAKEAPKGMDNAALAAKMEEQAAGAERPSSSSADRPQPLDLSHLTKPKIEEVVVDRINQDLPDPMANMAKELEQQGAAEKGVQADRLAAERQAQMELEVKRQATLDRGAADLARPDTLTSRVRAAEAIDNHPFVRKAEERLVKQEELVTKLSEQVQKGKAQATQLARAVKDLENFETAVTKTRENVGKGLGEGKTPLPFNFRKQGGAINPAVFAEGFQKLKKLEDGTWLRAFSNDGKLVVEATKDSHKMGGAVYEKTDKWAEPSKTDLAATATGVAPAARGKGLSNEIYKFAAELGNDIVPSKVRTEGGTKMWEKFKEQGVAKGDKFPFIPKSQKGAVLIDPGQGPQGKFLSENPALKLPTIVPSKLTAERAIELARAPGAKDVEQNVLQKTANLFTKGGMYQALKTNNPVIKFTYEKISEADRLARGDIQELVHDRLGPATRDMNAREKAQIWEAVDRADRLEIPLTPEMLREVGANEKQIAFVEAHREVMDRSFDAINRARATAGKDPISKRTAYAAMKATGDYRKLVYKLDEKGEKVVAGIVGGDLRATLNKRAEALEEQGYILGEEQYFGGVPREIGNAQQALAHTLEILAEHDPRIQEFLKTLDDINKNEAYSFLNMKKHTMQKKGVFGMEGRKTWETAEQNAKEGMQAQLQYAESALKWARLSEGIEAIRPVLADEGIKMPEAKKWADSYIKNALGYNPSKMGHNLEVAIAHGIGQTGVGYSNVRGGLAVARKTVNTMLLALDPGFWTANVLQPMRATPGMKAFLETKGLETNFDFGTGWSYLGKATITDWKARTGRPLGRVEQGAFDYAKTHHVYGSDLVEHSNRASKDAGYAVDKVGNFVASNIESGTRQLMYFTFVDMLHQNGLSVKNGLYEAAHNLTDMSMNNYSPVERPPVYNSLGPVGDVSVNLSSFKHNEFSRLALFARQIAEEKSAKPLLVEMAASVAFAGITGTIAFAEADWLYRQITKAAGKPDSLTLRVIKMSEGVGEKLGGGKHVLSHGGFSMMGVDMSKRLGLSNAVGDSAMDIAFPGGSKLVDVAEAGYNVAKSPTEMNAKRLAHSVVPRPAATNMELEWFSKEKPGGTQGANVRTLEAQTMRTPADKMAKRFGFTGINESVEKEKLFQTKSIKEAYADIRKKPLATARDELFSTGKVSDATVKKYLAAEGDIKTLMADISRMAKDQNIPAKDRELLRASMSKSITSLRHAQRLQKVYE